MPMIGHIPKTHLEYRWLVEYWQLPADDGTRKPYVPVGVWYQTERRSLAAYYNAPYDAMGAPDNSGGSATERATAEIARIHPANLANAWVLYGFMLKGPPVRRKGIYVSEIYEPWPNLLIDIALTPPSTPTWRIASFDIDTYEAKLEGDLFKPESWRVPQDEDERCFKYRYRSHRYGSRQYD